MSHHKSERKPLNSARNQTGGPTYAVPVSGDTPADATAPEDSASLHHTMPSSQPHTKAFLAGQTPGIMQRYAPNATASTVEGWVEDDETVERLRSFREQYPYGG